MPGTFKAALRTQPTGTQAEFKRWFNVNDGCWMHVLCFCPLPLWHISAYDRYELDLQVWAVLVLVLVGTSPFFKGTVAFTSWCAIENTDFWMTLLYLLHSSKLNLSLLPELAFPKELPLAGISSKLQNAL